MRQYDRAIEPLQKTIQLNPNFPLGRWYLGVTFEQRGSFDEAISQFETCVRLTANSPSMLALLGHAYAAAGRKSDAQAMLVRLGALSKEEKYVPPYPIAVIHAGLGERDQAIEWLEKAYEERDSWMNYLHLDPRLDSLRADPRFVSLVGRMRFTR